MKPEFTSQENFFRKGSEKGSGNSLIYGEDFKVFGRTSAARTR